MEGVSSINPSRFDSNNIDTNLSQANSAEMRHQDLSNIRPICSASGLNTGLQILALQFSPGICSAKKVLLFLFSEILYLSAHICMDAQTDNFAKTREELISRIGAAVARKLLRRALYCNRHKRYPLKACLFIS
ncbi:hypothetical protein DITRI_Ditri07aG0046500 [Diplodiscus trichospermus]